MALEVHRPPRLTALAAVAALAALALAPGEAGAAARKRARKPPSWAGREPGPCPAPWSPKLLCAPGKAERMPSEAGREAAATRARAALAAALRRLRGGEPAGAPDGEGAGAETLQGSAIVAVLQTRDGTWYALASVDPAAAGGRR